MKLKPALTYNQQIDRLVHIHNLTITQRETAISSLTAPSETYYSM